MDIQNSNKTAPMVVAMSGGVDSSVAAALLVEQGYNVIGITLQLYDHGAAIEKKGACCAGVDIDDARMVAHHLGIKHYVLDYESLFKEQVIDDFVESYIRGETPLPCVRCNQSVKFNDLFAMAKRLGAQGLVTGHYVQKHYDGATDKAHLLRGVDPQKDQSYFLFATTQEQLNFLQFPLGGQSKEVTRSYAKRYNLLTAAKPDSQDICFVPNGNYADIVKKIRPDSVKKGYIVDIKGTILAEHEGIIHYTIGQRKGLGIGGRKDDTSPLYVVAIHPESNQVVVGHKEDLAIAAIVIKDINWLGDMAWDDVDAIECMVQYRSQMPPIEALLKKMPYNNNGDKQAMVSFKNNQYGVSPGQALVLYHGNRLLGGGFITR